MAEATSQSAQVGVGWKWGNQYTFHCIVSNQIAVRKARGAGEAASQAKI